MQKIRKPKRIKPSKVVYVYGDRTIERHPWVFNLNVLIDSLRSLFNPLLYAALAIVLATFLGAYYFRFQAIGNTGDSPNDILGTLIKGDHPHPRVIVLTFIDSLFYVVLFFTGKPSSKNPWNRESSTFIRFISWLVIVLVSNILVFREEMATGRILTLFNYDRIGAEIAGDEFVTLFYYNVIIAQVTSFFIIFFCGLLFNSNVVQFHLPQWPLSPLVSTILKAIWFILISNLILAMSVYLSLLIFEINIEIDRLADIWSFAYSFLHLPLLQVLYVGGLITGSLFYRLPKNPSANSSLVGIRAILIVSATSGAVYLFNNSSSTINDDLLFSLFLTTGIIAVVLTPVQRVFFQ